jgi:hypothetical protein
MEDVSPNHADATGAINMCVVPIPTFDRLIVLRKILTMYACYYDDSHMHLSLHKDAPLSRVVQR